MIVQVFEESILVEIQLSENAHVFVSNIELFRELPINALKRGDFFHFGCELKSQIFDQLLHLVLIWRAWKYRLVLLYLGERFMKQPISLNLWLQFVRVLLDDVLVLHDLI